MRISRALGILLGGIGVLAAGGVGCQPKPGEPGKPEPKATVAPPETRSDSDIGVDTTAGGAGLKPRGGGQPGVVGAPQVPEGAEAQGVAARGQSPEAQPTPSASPGGWRFPGEPPSEGRPR